MPAMRLQRPTLVRSHWTPRAEIAGVWSTDWWRPNGRSCFAIPAKGDIAVAQGSRSEAISYSPLTTVLTVQIIRS